MKWSTKNVNQDILLYYSKPSNNFSFKTKVLAMICKALIYGPCHFSDLSFTTLLLALFTPNALAPLLFWVLPIQAFVLLYLDHSSLPYP